MKSENAIVGTEVYIDHGFDGLKNSHKQFEFGLIVGIDPATGKLLVKTKDGTFICNLNDLIKKY